MDEGGIVGQDVNNDEFIGNKDVMIDQMIFNLSEEDILGMEFDSEIDAQSFYCRYAYMKGFAVTLFDIA